MSVRQQALDRRGEEGRLGPRPTNPARPDLSTIEAVCKSLEP